MAKDRGAWLDRVTNGRIDIAMAAVLLAFFYYKGGAKLVFFLVVIFLFLVALFHLSSWLIRRYNRFRNRVKQPEVRSASERDSADLH
jgi:Kef-type K+ transport system membrane component KefB